MANIPPYEYRGKKKPYLERPRKLPKGITKSVDPKHIKKLEENAMRLVEAMSGYGNITPLLVMEVAMKEAFLTGRTEAAVEYAEKAAPYIHSRLQSTTLKGDPNAPVSVTIIDDIPRPPGSEAPSN
jgi:hypothetical protein